MRLFYTLCRKWTAPRANNIQTVQSFLDSSRFNPKRFVQTWRVKLVGQTRPCPKIIDLQTFKRLLTNFAFNVRKVLIAIGINTLSFSAIRTRMLTFLRHTSICLFSFSATFFRNQLLSKNLPLPSILTCFLKMLTFSSTWLEFSRNSSLHNVTLFNLFRGVSMSKL